MGCGFSIETQNSVKTQIRMLSSSFSPAERKIADAILADAAQVVEANVSELAEISRVSEATIVRFCKRLGYSGFYQMKLQLSHDIGRQQRNEIRYSGENSLQKRLNHISNRFFSLAQRLDSAYVKRCAQEIDNCGTVHVIGCGQSRILALDVATRLSGYGIRAIGGQEYTYQIANLLVAQPGDILLCVSKSGETRRVIRAAEIARDRGVTTIAVTGADKCPLVSVATYALSAGLSPDDDPDSNICLAGVLEALFTYLRSKLPDVVHIDSIVSESRI